MGNVVHKVMETLAQIKLNKQNGIKLTKDENLGNFDVLNFNIDDIIEKSFNWHKKISTFRWEDKDLNSCKEWVYNTLEFNDGKYNPLNLDIISIEQPFDLIIDKEWANYDYKVGNENIKGKLGIKGYIDLITKIDNDFLNIIDWKTGSRTKFPTKEVKTFEDFMEDFQFLLYTYAARKLYPDKEIILTVFYCRDTDAYISGGPFTLPFSKKDDEKVEWMIRRKFNEIKNTKVPKLNRGWWCKICPYYKNFYENSNLNLCEHYEKEVRKNSVDKIFLELGGVDKINEYGDGGGKHSLVLTN